MRYLVLIAPLIVLSACQKTETPAAEQAVAAASAPAPGSVAAPVQATEVCDGDGAWLQANFQASHGAIPDGTADCAFYQAAWQHFLEATEGPDPKQVAFLKYPDVAGLFGAAATPLSPVQKSGMGTAALKVVQLPNDPSGTKLAAFDAGVRQAGNPQGILVDRNGNPIFYSIHVNPAFQSFTTVNHLVTADQLRNAPPTLAINDGAPGSDGKPVKLGVAEYKAAWQIVEDSAHAPNGFITQVALVPTIHRNGDALTLDAAHPRQVTLALISFHVAFTLDNHPEMIWATFEHLAADSTADKPFSDVAPSAVSRPPAAPVISNPERNYTLFAANSAVAQANAPADPHAFDEASQKFKSPTPIYRVYPGSKVNEDDVDDAIVALDKWMANHVPTLDVRRNYRLIGAVWLKKPGMFAPGKHFFNKDGQSSDDADAMLSGEAALSSTAMESFTQAPDSQPHCFSCHDTALVRSSPAPGKVLVTAKEVNVSHVMSRFLSELP